MSTFGITSYLSPSLDLFDCINFDVFHLNSKHLFHRCTFAMQSVKDTLTEFLSTRILLKIKSPIAKSARVSNVPSGIFVPHSLYCSSWSHARVPFWGISRVEHLFSRKVQESTKSFAAHLSECRRICLNPGVRDRQHTLSHPKIRSEKSALVCLLLDAITIWNRYCHKLSSRHLKSQVAFLSPCVLSVF